MFPQFAGRYGRIARLYGTDATYDAIKSFFAKEVVKMAEDLKTRVEDHSDDFDEIPHGQCSAFVRRPIHLVFDDNDDEIIVMGEREVDLDVRNGHTARKSKQSKSSSGLSKVLLGRVDG